MVGICFRGRFRVRGWVCSGCFWAGLPHVAVIEVCKYFCVYCLEEDFEGLLRVFGSHKGADGLSDHVGLDKFTFFEPVGVAVEAVMDVFLEVPQRWLTF